MSRFLGEIRQLGYVVHDIEAAMDYWSRTLGAVSYTHLTLPTTPYV